MTTQIPPKSQNVQTAAPRIESLPLDEGIWRAWVERNEARDKVKFARRMKVMAVLAILALAVLVQRVAGSF